VVVVIIVVVNGREGDEGIEIKLDLEVKLEGMTEELLEIVVVLVVESG
jgi:hypothetical protein